MAYQKVHISLSNDTSNDKIINMIIGHEDSDQLVHPSNLMYSIRQYAQSLLSQSN